MPSSIPWERSESLNCQSSDAPPASSALGTDCSAEVRFRNPSLLDGTALACLTVCLLLVAFLPWSAQYFPGQDGPNHFAVARIASDLIWHPNSLAARFYEFRPDFYTNYATEVFGIVLIPFVGAVATEKLLFMLLAVSIPLAIIACMRAVGSKATPFMLLTVPYGYAATLGSGNYNFLVALTIGLFVMAYILKTAGDLTAKSTICLAITHSACAFIHPAATLVTMFYVGVLVFGQGLACPANPIKRLLIRCLTHVGTMLPGVVVIGAFMLSSPPSDLEYQRSVWLRFREIVIQYELYKLGKYEIALALMTGATIGVTALLVLAQRQPLRFRRVDTLLLAALMGTILYFVSPNKMSGGDAFVSRIETLPWICVLIWLTAQRHTKMVLWTVLLVGAAMQAIYLVGEYRAQQYANKDIAKFFQLARQIPDKAIVLPLIGADGIEGETQRKWNPFLNLYQTLSADRGTVFLTNWIAHYRVSNVRYKASVDPYMELWHGSNEADALQRYTARTGITPTWILAWRIPIGRFKEFEALLDQQYEMVTQTEERAMVSGLYRLRAQ